MEEAVLSKLDQVVARFGQLSKQLEDPKIYADNASLQKVGKERKGLETIVETYQRYRKVERELIENRELERSGDAELTSMVGEELARLKAEHDQLEDQLGLLLQPKDPFDEKNVILEIRAGTGGEEAALFAGDLYRMYQRYSDVRGWRTEVMNQSEASAGGIKEISVLLSGDRVFSQLKFEGGVHRVQRVPETEAQGRIHTSTVTVVVLPEADELDVSLDEKDLDISVCRAGGPGGQGVNTTDSAVIIKHIPSGITVRCQDERSQQKNKSKAKKVLLARLFEVKRREQEAELSISRRSMVGGGERAEKIRTYNFPQNRITDHRIGLTLHKLDRIMEGDLTELLEAVKTFFQAEALKNANP